MKKLYTLLVLAAFGASSAMAVEAPTPIQRIQAIHQKAQKKAPAKFMKANKKKASMRANEFENYPIWCAKEATVSYWNDDTNAWVEESKLSTTFNEKGWIMTETMDVDLGKERTTYTYDYKGRRTSAVTAQADDGVNYTDIARVETSYDDLTGVVTEQKCFYLINNVWTRTGNNYCNEVVRNEAGNITSITSKIWDEVAEKYTTIIDRFTVTYGADGKATNMILEDNYDGVYEPFFGLDNIVWNTTNGQFSSVEDYTTSANQVKSCTMTYYDGEDITTQTADFSYPDDHGSYVATIKGMNKGSDYQENFSGTEEKVVLDHFGSYDFCSNITYGEGSDKYTDCQVVREHVGMDGLILLVFESDTFDGETEIYGWQRGEFTYDPTDGHPTQHILEELLLDGADAYSVKAIPDMPQATGEWLPVAKVEFSDVFNAAGIENVTVDANAPVEFYNLQGVRLSSEPQQGFYIRRQGGKAVKMVK